MKDLKNKLFIDAKKIYTGAIESCLPDSAVSEALANFSLPKGRLILIAIGKAAWKMTDTAARIIKDELHGKIHAGVVITKYNHSEGKIDDVEIYEAGHPLPDANGIAATERALAVTDGLAEEDLVLFLISGGGSALFESPVCTLDELADITRALLGSGADINEINAVRKHLSKVKGGRFAEHIAPARFYSVVLSDVLGNRLDSIASGPTAPDTSSLSDVARIIRDYSITLPDGYSELLKETPKKITNGTHFVAGSVSELCRAAKRISEDLGYKAEIITDSECGEARALGERLARYALEKCDTDTPVAFIVGGETVVKLKGSGLGGRNQEIALSASRMIAAYGNIAVFSVGSDGTDGPTDAAGGYVDGESYYKMQLEDIDPAQALDNNDSYRALGAIDSLIVTGPTGTNVNDLSVALVLPLDKEALKKRKFSNLERVLNNGLNEKQ